MSRTPLDRTVLAVMIALFCMPLGAPAFSADTSFGIAANSTRDTREQSGNHAGSGAFASGQGSSGFTCSGGVCDCTGWADCTDMALTLECTVIFSPCTGCPTTTGYCRPGE
jgi:hypothetical protein